MIAVLLLAGAIVLMVLLGVLGWIIGTYNTFVTAMNDLREMWSNIKTETQRRADLILNLVETAKGSLRFEQETLTAVTQARAGFFGKTKTDEIKNLGKLNTLFANMMGRIEAYPKLESLSTMHVVMEELRTTENRINIARTDYNETVRDYNILVESFPARMIAANFGFTVEEFFDAEPEASKAPKVSFDTVPSKALKPLRKAAKKKVSKRKR